MAAGPVQISGYELLRQLGTGGMSTVWLALQQSLDRKVAIKIMRRVSDTSPDDARQFEKRFLLEGRTMARLPHRNIVAVYDIVSTDEVAYIAMEFLEGGTLAERMKEGLSLGEAVAVVIQIAGALGYAHNQGIIHRDLKPANIMFRDGMTPVLTDFGIARQQDATATRLTQTGMLVGTPNYMSPEQISGGDIDGRSDLYSLGIMFYELLTGHTPFNGDTPIAVMMAHLTQPAPPLPDDFAHFQPIMDVLLAKSREERFPTMNDFVVAVKQGVVESDTLMTRLQIDPNLSTSEQLRKIGFSLSDPTGNSWRSLTGPGSATPLPRTGEGQIPRTPSGRVPAPVPARAPSVRVPVQRRPAQEEPPPPRSRWPLYAALAAAVLLAVGGGVVWKLRGGGGLSERDRELAAYRLKDAERLVDEGKLLNPPKDNAFEVVQTVQQLDPTNEQAEALLERIARTLQEQADKALRSGDLAAAATAVQGGLVVRKDDAALIALSQRIDAERGALEKKRQLEQYLAGAAAAQKSGRPFGPDSVYAQLRKAQELVPQDAGVRQRLDAFIAEQLAPAKTALAEKDPQRAGAMLETLRANLGNEGAFTELAKSVESAGKAAEQERKIVAALQRARDQLKAGHLAEPDGNNAVESLQALRDLAAGDNRVTAFATDLANTLVEDGRRSKDPQHALERADQALKAVPQLSAATALKNDVEQKLNQGQRDIANALSSAKQALGEKRFLAPANNNARTALDAVLKLDPGNKEAKQLAAELPKRILEAAEARATGDAAAALTLAKDAAAAYPGEANFGQLIAKLDAQLGKEKAAAQARESRERITSLLATSPVGADKLRAATKELASLLAAEPKDADALALRKRLTEAFAADLQAADTPAQLDLLVAAAKDAATPLKDEPGYLALPNQANVLRTKLVEAEQARVAASQGELVFNAQPWGRVESVLDANRKPVELPSDATTPFKLTLPAGNYTVTFSHPQTRQPVRVLAKVEAKQRAVVTTAFPTINAEDYFSRAGW
jgi:serine/threonine-protein kinase PpkA